MDSRSGQIYPSRIYAVEAGVPIEHLVEISGPPDAIKRVSDAVADARKKDRRKTQRNARRRNR